MECPLGVDHPPLKTLAVCHDCHIGAARDLTFMERNLPLLSLEPQQGTLTSRTPPASKPPLRVGVLSFTAQGGLVATLGEWVQVLVEAGRCNHPNYRLAPAPTVIAQLRLLHKHLNWLLTDDARAAPFVVEMHTASDTLAHLLDPDRTWLPLPGRWTCPTIDPETGPCGGLLRQHKGKWLVRCPVCRTEWEGDGELERLGRLLGCELEVTVAQAAVIARVTDRTIYQWVRSGTLPIVSDDPILIDTRDLALSLSARQIDNPQRPQ